MNCSSDNQHDNDVVPNIPGRLIGWASTKGISTGRRWRELFFYQTSTGRLLCHRVDRCENGDERDRHSVFVVPDQASMRALQ